MSKTQTSQSIENENIQDVEGVDNSKANHDASAPGGQSKQQPSTMSREAFLARVEQLYEQALEAGSLTVAASQLKLLSPLLRTPTAAPTSVTSPWKRGVKPPANF